MEEEGAEKKESEKEILERTKVTVTTSHKARPPPLPRRCRVPLPSNVKALPLVLGSHGSSRAAVGGGRGGV